MTVRCERNGFRRYRAVALAGTAAVALVLSACGSKGGAAATSAGSAAGSVLSSAGSAAQSETSATGSSSETGSPSAAGSSSETGSSSEMGSSSSSATGSSSSSSESSSSEMSSSATGSSSGSSPAESSSSSASGSASAVQMTGDKSKVKVGMAYDVGGRGDQSFNDSAARGLDKAKGEGVKVTGEIEATTSDTDAQREDRLRQLAEGGATVIVAVGFAYEPALAKAAPDYPNVHFAIIDDSQLCDGSVKGDFKNVACLTFAEEQGSYLVGVAAALKSKASKIGFIGGVNTPLIQKFQAGFEAGVKATKPDDTVDSKYITEPPDFSGFSAPDKGQTIAKGMYDGGADIVYAAAGGSGAGVFKAAKAAGKQGIGVDSDQYNAPTLKAVQSVILTSMVKNVDVAVYDDIVAAVNGSPLTGHHTYDLKSGGVGYATSGDFVKDIVPQLDAAKAKIVSGEIKVPAKPGS